MTASHSRALDPLGDAAIKRLVVLAPNWLGDAVMALPALADVRRSNPAASITVAARPAVAPLFTMVPGIPGVAGTIDVLTLDNGGPVWRDSSGPLRARSFDAALLFPSSFQSALTVSRAGIRERWGYASDFRRPLLTRHARKPGGVHQAAFYQHLTQAMGFGAGPLEPRLEVAAAERDGADRLLRDAGWDGRAPLVALAPGAAYGGAKRWPGRRFAAAARQLATAGVLPVLVGTTADAAAGREVAAALAGRTADVAGDDVAAALAPIAVLNLIGRTDLPTLAAVLVTCRALITNDSGAMHLAAALGVPVTAVFGPTDETATHPLGSGPRTVLTHRVWCRPCMLRECPLTHGCMHGVTPEAVADAARLQIAPAPQTEHP